MLELFLNTVTREWYDKDGNPFRDGMPRGAYQSREDVKITLCKETPNAGAAGVDVSTWTRDASLASVSGIGAMLTIDSDRIHKLKGELSGEVSAGAVSTITATIENASNAIVPESGTLRLFDESGDYEAIAYTDRSIVDGEATFTVSGSVSGSYAVGSVIDCDQSPYAQAYLDTSASNLEQGELVFYLVIDSQRLRSEMDYSDVATLSIAGLELLIYRTADGASEPVTAYLCETYSVTGTLGSVGNESQPPDATEDKLAGLVDQLLAAGLDVEHKYDSEGNTQFRVRSVSAGGTWSSWITVQKGEQGEPGKSFSVDATGLMSERTQYDAEAAGFSFLATDEGNLYIKNSDTSGDWSDAIPFQGPAGADGEPGPANTLTIGTVTTGEPGTQAAASITGEAPNQVLNLTIPRGDKGEAGSGGGTADSVAWDDVTGKPSTFPPSSHTHEIANVNGLQSALDAKGTVKSVNGVEPDAGGNVTIETGSSVDESRLLPEDASNNELAIKKVGDAGIDANTFLMLHFDEESGTPVDSSQSSLAINAGDTAVYSNGKFSRARNLNNSYVSTTCSAMATGTGDFTYDGWFYLTSTSKRRGLFASGSNCICFAAWEDNKFALGLSSTGSGWTYDHFDNNRFDFTFSANTWYHIAVVRNGNTLTVYINGNSISSFDVSNLDVPAVSGTDAFKIGYPLGGMSNSTDIVDEFRFSNVARWTEDFTPPDHAYTSASEYWESIDVDDLTSLMDANKLVPAISEQDVGKVLSVAGSQVQEGNDENTFLLLHFDGNTTDSSDNARSDITSNGVSFPNGKFNKAAQFSGSTSSYVAIPNTSEFPFSGDFTISFWAKASDSSRRGLIAYQNDHRLCIDTIDGVYSIWASSNGSSWDILQADSSYSSSLTSDSGRGSIAVMPGVWQHIAYVHSGEDWYLFVDGVMSTHKQRSGQVYNAGEELRIGRYGNDNIDPFAGWIDEFKIDTVARWTSDFTPPDHAYDSFISEGIHTEFTDIGNKIDEKISAHNQDSSAHPDKPGFPNYSAGVTITSAFNTAEPYSYTFEQSGWLFARCRPGGTFTINGSGMILVSDSGGPYLCTFVPVFAGDVLTGTTAAASLIFYPNR